MTKNREKPLIFLAVTSSKSAGFFKGQINYLIDAGFEVALICAPGDVDLTGIKVYFVPMQREISPFHDLLSLWKLIRLIRRCKPDIVNTGTPKAGLLVGIAAVVNRVPHRIYMMRGLRLETLTGWKRRLLTITEAISSFCSHKVICVSESLRKKVVELKIVQEAKTIVIHSGSSNGKDTSRFVLTDAVLFRTKRLREKYKIDKESKVIGYVGRLTKDKGILELKDAFNMLRTKIPEVYLILCGDFEEGDPLPEEVKNWIERDPRVIQVDFVEDIVPYYHIMDVIAFPSHREGFPNVILEAQAARKPVVAARSTGCVDAVIDGQTGFLVNVGDSIELANKLEKIIISSELAQNLGLAGYKRVYSDFRPEDIWAGYVNIYMSLLKE